MGRLLDVKPKHLELADAASRLSVRTRVLVQLVSGLSIYVSSNRVSADEPTMDLTNLALKGILGIKAFAEIARAMGQVAEAQGYQVGKLARWARAVLHNLVFISRRTLPQCSWISGKLTRSRHRLHSLSSGCSGI